MSIHPNADLVTESCATLTGAAVIAAILAAEHLLMFDRRDEYSPLARYTLGVAALGIGHTLACALAGDALGALRLWVVVAAGGGTVLGLYAARGELRPADGLAWVDRGVRRLLG